MNETPTIVTLLTPGNITFALGILGVLFTVYKTFANPQIKTDQTTTKLQDDVTSLKKEILEVRETHLRNVENDLKLLTTSVNELSKTVVKLSTIIDERIPKEMPGLTPPGV